MSIGDFEVGYERGLNDGLKAMPIFCLLGLIIGIFVGIIL